MPDAIVNNVPTNYGSAMSLLAEMLVAAGWTFQGSGDGLSGYSASGKIFTHTGSGALGWHNAKAYCRLADPAARREFILQHDAAGGARIKYSALSKFIGGAPAAAVPPSAADERVIRGGGTDAAPTYGAAFFGASTATGLAKYLGFARGTDPFGFWFAGANAPVGLAVFTALMLDPVVSVPEDPDPVVIHCATTGAYTSDGYTSTSGQFITSEGTWPAPGGTTEGCWGHMDVAMTKFPCLMPSIYVVGGDYGGVALGTSGYCIQNAGLGSNPFNAKWEALPIFYMRLSAVSGPYGIKGRSVLARWTTFSRPSLITTMDGRKLISVGDLWLPWDGVTAPIS